MRRIVSTSLVAVGLLAVTYAQESRPGGGAPTGSRPTAPFPTNPSPSTAQTPANRANDAANLIVVTGCVAGGPGSFMLTNAMAANSTTKPGDSAVGTSGIAPSYELRARAGIDLSSHVGHKVEITGTSAGNASTAGSPGASTVDRSTAGASGAATDRASDRPRSGADRAATDPPDAGASGAATDRAANRAGAGGIGGEGSAAGGSPSGRASVQRLTVTALKMVSTTCS